MICTYHIVPKTHLWLNGVGDGDYKVGQCMKRWARGTPTYESEITYVFWCVFTGQMYAIKCCKSYSVIFHLLMGACSKTISTHFHTFSVIYLGHQSKPLSRDSEVNAPAEKRDLTYGKQRGKARLDQLWLDPNINTLFLNAQRKSSINN